MIITSGLLLLSSYTLAKINGRFEVHIRPEYVSINNDFKQTGTKNVAKFQSEYNKIALSGKVNNELTYKFRYNFNTSGSVTSVTDGTLNRLEYAYLTYALYENVSLSFGKMWYLFGGREYDYNGLDVYTYSDASLNIPFYEMGAMLSYKLGKNTFYLQGTNPNDTTSDSGSSDVSNSVGTAVGWYSDFGNGMIKPIFSLGIRPFSRQAREDKHYAAGIQFNFGKSQFEIDYSVVDSELENNVKGDSFDSKVLLYRYSFSDKFKPHIKYIFDNKETADVKQYSKYSYDVALEYFPKGISDFNLHLVYSSARTDSKVSTVVDSNIQTIRFGFKLKHDLFSM